MGCSELCGKLRGKREREEKPKKQPAVKPTSTDRTEEDKEDGETEGQEEGEGEGRKPPEELLPVSAGVTDAHTYTLTVWSLHYTVLHYNPQRLYSSVNREDSVWVFSGMLM